MSNSQDLSWRKLVSEAEATLGAAAVPDPDISARLIGQRATGAEPGEWADVLDGAPHKRQLAHFDAMVERRSQGEPLQYVLGQWGFRHLDLFIDHRVLIPRPETELVAGLAIDEVHRIADVIDAPAPSGVGRALTVVDLGTGSGAIGLSVAFECSGKIPLDVAIWLTDVSDDALAVARANLAGLGTRGSGVQLASGSWFEALSDDLRRDLDVVVANPPYVDAEDEIDPQIRWEPGRALFAEPADRHLVHLVENAPGWLTDDGALVLEMAPDQTQPIRALASKLFARVEVHTDLAGRQRAVVAAAPIR